MCVIIYIPQGKTISPEELEEAWWTNPDGGGIAWIQDKKVHVKKGYMDYNEYLNECGEVIFNKDLDRVIHLRITSKGTSVPSQTHPFPLSENPRDLCKLEFTTTKPVVAMNGTLNLTAKKGFNDTQTWIMDTLHKYTKKLPQLYKKLNKNHCKWAIISRTRIKVTKDFTCIDGVYYSNTYHKMNYFTSYKKRSNKKDDKYDWYGNNYGMGYFNPDYDYDSDPHCSYCFLYGIDCVECSEGFLNFFEEINNENYTTLDKFFTKKDEETTVYQLDYSEAK